MLKKLLEKRNALLNELNADDITEEKFNEIRGKIDRLNYQIEQAKLTESENRDDDKQEETEIRKQAARPANGELANTGKAAEEEKRKAETDELEKRAAELKNGKTIKFAMKPAGEEKRGVTSSSTPLDKHVSGTINPAFEQVGTLDKLVDVAQMPGGESYEQPFLKSYASGGITAEGADYTSAEPEFGYAPITKVKITAYAEVTEEVAKLPSANYLAEVEKAIRGAMRIKKIQQILNGTGATNGQFVGIANTPTSIIAATETKTIEAIDEDTFDEIVYAYGGDENVEDDAVFIMNKLTLRKFAEVKDENGHSVYDIKLYGNTATLNGVGVVLSSHVAAFGSVADGKAYLYYGKLKGYKLTEFSDMEVAISTDFKFKQGQICFRASQFCGGSPAIYNGFISVIKASA